MRELSNLYSSENQIQFLQGVDQITYQNIDQEKYVDIVCELLLNGHTFELLDGDNSELNAKLLSAIFRKLQSMLIQNGKKLKFLPLSIVGPQSSGKSTLINQTFGSNFKVSAGRCTRGMDVSLKYINHNNEKFLILVMDTEGLLSIEKADEKFDKKLTLFSMVCSKLLIINVNGEINTSMKKILAMSVFAGNQMQSLQHRPDILFVLRNMKDTNPENIKQSAIAIKKELLEIAKLNKVELENCLSFNETQSLILMRDAFKDESVFWKGSNKLFMKTTTSQDFLNSIELLKDKIYQQNLAYKGKSIEEWINVCISTWKSIQDNYSLFDIESLKEILDRNSLNKDLQSYLQIIKPELYTDLMLIVNQFKEQQFSWEKKIQYENKLEEKYEYDLEKKYVINFEKVIDEKYCNINLINEYIRRLKQNLKEIFEVNLHELQRIYYNKNIESELEKSILAHKKDVEKLNNDYNIDKNKDQQNKQDLIDLYLKKYDGTIEKQLENLKEKLENKIKKKQDLAEKVRIQCQNAINQFQIQDRPFDIQQVTQLITNNQQLILLQDQYQLEYINKNMQPKNDMIHYNQDEFVSDFVKKLFDINVIKSNLRQPDLYQQNSYMIEKNQKKVNDFTYIQNSKIYTQEQIKTQQNEEFLLQNFGNYSINFSQQEQQKQMLKDQECLNIINFIIAIQKRLQYLKEVELKDKKYNFFEVAKNISSSIDSMKKIHEKGELHIEKSMNNQIFATIFEYFIQNEENNQKKEIEQLQDKFRLLASEQRDWFEKEIRGALNDQQQVEGLSIEIKEQVCQCIQQNTFDEIFRTIHQNSSMQTDVLTEECEQLISDKSDQDFDQIMINLSDDDKNNYRLYFEDICKLMKQVYMSYFDKMVKDKISIQFQDYEKNIKSELKLIDMDLETLQKNISKIINLESQKQNKVSKITEFEQLKQNEINQSVLDEIQKLNAQIIVDFLENNDLAIVKQNLQTRIALIEFLEKNDQNISEENLKLQIDQISKNCNLDDFEFNRNRSEGKSKYFGKLFKGNSPACLVKIQNIQQFIDNLRKYFVEKQIDAYQFNKDDFITLFKSKFQSELNDLKENKFIEARGCNERCPYCGQKCNNSDKEHVDHTANKHRWMAFNGSCERNNDNKKILLKEFCNSMENINKKWKKGNEQKQINEQMKLINERIGKYSLSSAKVMFSLFWNNKNDLDLYVKCPCGTIIYLANKQCNQCEAYLEKDMNVVEVLAVDDPIEHVIMKNNPPPNKPWEVWVQFWNAKNPVTQENFVKYELVYQSYDDKNIKLNEEFIINDGIIYTDSPKSEHKFYTPQILLSQDFKSHVKENYPNWHIQLFQMNAVDDNVWMQKQKNAWKIIGKYFCSLYNGSANRRLP